MTLNNLVQLDDIRMPDQLQYVNLSTHPLNIRAIHDFLFFQNLDGNLLTCRDMRSQLDFPERTFSDRFFNAVLADCGGVGVCGIE
jgi:hypothetical protein